MWLVLIKRAVPFALTLALGMLIASFFVSLSLPKIKFGRRYQYRNECRWNADRERARREFQNFDYQSMDKMVPPPPVAPAIPFDDFTVRPPVAPTVSRSHR